MRVIAIGDSKGEKGGVDRGVRDRAIAVTRKTNKGRASRLVSGMFTTRFTGPSLATSSTTMLGPPIKGVTISASKFVMSPTFFPKKGVKGLSVYKAMGSLTYVKTGPLCLAYTFIVRRKFPVRGLRRVTRTVTGATGRTNIHVMSKSAGITKGKRMSKIFVAAAKVKRVRSNMRINKRLTGPKSTIVMAKSVNQRKYAVLLTERSFKVRTSIGDSYTPL